MNFLPKKVTSSKNSAFTILELLIVVAVIAILAGLVITTAGFIQNKVARARTSAEVESLSAAIESYRMEMGEYPSTSSMGTPSSLANPTLATGTTNVLVAALCPPSGLPGSNNIYNPQSRRFYEFSKSMLTNTANNHTNAILDPFGVSYGYRAPGTYNTNSYDLWSTAGNATNTNLWIKNW